MRPQLPEETKRGVIRLWLSGLGRDNIARLTNISAGAVTNIVNKWREDIGKAEADAMRELAKSIRASNLSPAQCEVGFRILNILIKEGLDADKAEKFLSTTYRKCESADISPDNIVSHIEDLTEFSDEIRLPEIELHIKQETNKKEELDKQICERQEKVSSLKREEEELIKKRDCAFEQQKKAGEDFKIFVEAKQELERLNLSINNVPKFAQTV